MSHKTHVEREEEKRLLIWEVSGGVLALIAGIVIIVIFSWVSGYVKRAHERAQEILEANRPVDAVSVVVQDMQKEKIVDTIVLPGRFEAWEKSEVSAEVSANVVSRLKEGTAVKKGDVILTLDNRDYQIRFLEAKGTFAEAEQNFLRKQKLRKKNVNALSELEKASATYAQAKSSFEAAKLALERCEIKSPLDGVVDTVLPEVGELVKQAECVAVVAKLGELKVEVGIPEKDIDSVRDIEECQIEVEAANVTVTGVRTYLSYLPAANSQVYILRLKVPNQNGELRPGMFGNVKVVREVRRDFLVPIYSVLAKDAEHYVFVTGEYTPPKGKGKDPRALRIARKVPVTLGVMQGTSVEVTGGMKAGDKLVVVGQRNIDEDTVMSVVREVANMSELTQ